MIDNKKSTMQSKSRENLFNKYAYAAVNLYGVIKLSDFIEVFNHYEEEKTNKKEAKERLTILATLYPLDLNFKNDIIASFYDLEDNQDLEEAKKLFKHQNNKPRYLPEKTEFLRFADDSYVEPMKPLLDLEIFIVHNLKVQQSEPGDIRFDVLELHDQIVYGQPLSEFYSYINRRGYTFKDEEQLQGFISHIMIVNNNTRMFENNGHTPIEIRKLTILK